MKSWIFWLIAGVVAIVTGVIAIINPLAASLAAVVVTGWGFLMLGVLQVIGAVVEDGWGQRIWSLLLGVLGVAIGFWLVSRPAAALLPMTFLVGWTFLIYGLLKVFAARSLRGSPFFWTVLLSGALSFLLGVLIFTDIPAASVSVLGILFAIELISTGVTVTALALAIRKAGRFYS